MKSSNSPGTKALTAAGKSGFTAGVSQASDSRDASKRMLPKSSQIGTTKRPMLKGAKYKFFDQQGVPVIKKSATTSTKS